MQVRPNESIFVGHIKALRPKADGWGAEIDLNVIQNLSDADQDFVQSKPGEELTLFVPNPKGLAAGDHVRITATLNAGPTGGNVVARSIVPERPPFRPPA